MQIHNLADNIYALPALDWDRRLFDELIPLPDGTTYNAYVVQGSRRTALIDAVDPTKQDELLAALGDLNLDIDYLVAHHAEQDHSGAIPAVLDQYPEAQVLCTPKGKPLLRDHLRLRDDQIAAVEDGHTLSLGDATLKFLYAPWVHWPETMLTYLPEHRI
ncbi:MAG: FprA family A-type flavoprotein, partial [Candidatus Thermoplasmatota archaeon]|nr:FprA family A-type flavoprotein [Candidatus Thermoplasmatota archaeon]